MIKILLKSSEKRAKVTKKAIVSNLSMVTVEI